MIRRILAAVLITFIFATPAAAETEANIPFLTWENGKTQTILMGGPASDVEWELLLEGSETDPLRFSRSSANREGLFLYTLDIPRNLEPGGYVVNAVEPSGAVRVVAGIQIKDRESYRITQIPTDLRLLAIIFAGITAIFSVVRSLKYAQMVFMRRKVTNENFLYRLRDRRLGSTGDSIARFVVQHSGEPLHRMSTFVWSLIPWLAIPLGIYTAVQIQFDAAIPNGPIILFFICAAIGALDATAGISLAFSLGFMHVALGNVTNLRSLLVAATFTLAWYFPAIFASLVRLALPRDLMRLPARVADLVSALVAALVGGCSVVLATILTDSLVINREASQLLRWPMAGLVAAVIFFKYLFASLKSFPEEEEVRIHLARVVSPGLATTLFFGTLLLVFVWTNEITATVVASLVISAPYFLLFVIFPKLARLKLPRVRRNMLLEALIVVALTFGVYMVLHGLPISVIEMSRAFILLGLVPSLLHAIYSVVIASNELAALRAEKEVTS